MKQRPPLPGFLCFAAEEMADENLRRLSLAERGLYHWLRLLCWSNGSAPAAPAELAKMLGVRTSEVVKALTPAVLDEQLFVEDKGRLFSKEIEPKRAEALRKTRNYSENGKRGAEARWGGRPNARANGEAIAIRKEGIEKKTVKDTETPLSKMLKWTPPW